MHCIYSWVTRYLLLDTLGGCPVYSRIDCFLELSNDELNEISRTLGILIGRFFAKEFQKILEGFKEVTEIAYAEFIFSRCALLCQEPTTYSSFLLVAAFLSNLVLMNVNDLSCFRILYISEFCFNVLYRRLFWKVRLIQKNILEGFKVRRRLTANTDILQWI